MWKIKRESVKIPVQCKCKVREGLTNTRRKNYIEEEFIKKYKVTQKCSLTIK
jgi:hypothetical protein